MNVLESHFVSAKEMGLFDSPKEKKSSSIKENIFFAVFFSLLMFIGWLIILTILHFLNGDLSLSLWFGLVQFSSIMGPFIGIFSTLMAYISED